MKPYSVILAALAFATPVATAQQTNARMVAMSSSADTVRDEAIGKLEAFLARYPDSELRPNALFQLGELLVRKADEEFADAQRAAGTDTAGARGDVPIRPNYEPAMGRYEELVRRFPDFAKRDAAAYTLGTQYFSAQRYADAARMFELVTQDTASRFRPEAYFRLGDAYFEMAAQQRGTARRQTFARAAEAYEAATQTAPANGDIYFLALYKLGWAYYNQATATNQEEYRKAVDVFGRLVASYDMISPEQQSRLGLQAEAIEYMAIAFTQIGGADAADQFFTARQNAARYRLPVMRRVAQSLRDQGDFARAVEAYRAVITEAPTDSATLAIQREVIDIYQNRVLDAERAQEARLQLVENFGPNSEWARANPGLVDEANRAREEALRQSAQYRLSQAQQRNDRERFAEAAALYGRYMQEFTQSDSAQRVALLYGEALYGQRNFTEAGTQYARAAYEYPQGDREIAQRAGQNAIVAFDSALVRNKTDRAAQDAMFSAVDRYVAAFPDNDLAKRALIQKGRRASETERWDVMAQTFQTYAQRYPNDPYTPTAQKLVGDALYRGGQYAEAQTQWETALTVAQSSGRRSLADSIARVRTAAAATFADTLVKQGEYRRAAEEIYVAFAERNPNSARAPDALRDAIEVYMLADSAARSRNDEAASRQARERAIELSQRLVTQYPNYRYRLQYQALQSRLLADVGRREEAVEATRALIRDNPRWEGRADAMVRLAVTLDSLGRKAEAAQAYEEFSRAYPRDRRAADAQLNAAVTFAEAGDTTAAARAYGTFATRFPSDERAGQARQTRLTLLRAAGDTAAASRELAQLCARPTPEIRGQCAARVAESHFRRGAALWTQYQAMRFVIPSAAQLTAAGVQRASRAKQNMLRTMTTHFTNAIKTGNARWLAAATYHLGLAQWDYGMFFRNVQLPSGLTPEERAAGEQGAAQQAEQHFEAARRTWQSLVEKAEQEAGDFAAPEAAEWVERAREALRGNVPEQPPMAMGAREPSALAGGVQ
ncbi:MAG: tetratricopeptide repeat protein [Gemmatimonadota bacterium]|nr:tetratricopeptide repeat protein [Gemmatimonadota bacterium]